MATTITQLDLTTSTTASTTTQTYNWRDGAMLASSTTAGVTTGYNYDAKGYLTKVDVGGTSAYGMIYLNNEQGLVMDRLQVASGTSSDGNTVSQWLTQIASVAVAGKQANYYIGGKTIGAVGKMIPCKAMIQITKAARIPRA